MFGKKTSIAHGFISVVILWIVFNINFCVAASQKVLNEKDGSCEVLEEYKIQDDSCKVNGSKTEPNNWVDFVCEPVIKYSPVDWEKVPYDAFPKAFDSWAKFKKDMDEKHGTKISILLDDHHQHILNGPGTREGRNIFWWNLTVKQYLWDCGNLVFKARGGSGTSEGNPPNGITPLVGSRLNLDWAAYETELVYIANLYLEQKFCDKKLMIALGKITFPSFFDENKVAGWDFFSHSLARNQAFPHRYHTIGALGRYSVTDNLYLQAGVTDAQGIRSETGLNTTFHDEDYFQTLTEMGIKTTDEKGLEINYRFNIWYDPQPLTRYDGSGSERDNVGYGFNMDRMLTEKIGAFFRYGFNDGRVRKFEHCWSFGGTWKGIDPARQKDILGFGFAQGITHQDFRTANNATRTETILEAYYRIFINEWCSLTLDIQTLLNPGTNSNNDTGVISGFRLKILL